LNKRQEKLTNIAVCNDFVTKKQRRKPAVRKGSRPEGRRFKSCLNILPDPKSMYKQGANNGSGAAICTFLIQIAVLAADQYAAVHPSRRGSLPAINVPLSNSRMYAHLYDRSA
jgi:hypothetical protein